MDFEINIRARIQLGQDGAIKAVLLEGSEADPQLQLFIWIEVQKFMAGTQKQILAQDQELGKDIEKFMKIISVYAQGLIQQVRESGKSGIILLNGK